MGSKYNRNLTLAREALLKHLQNKYDKDGYDIYSGKIPDPSRGVRWTTLDRSEWMHKWIDKEFRR